MASQVTVTCTVTDVSGTDLVNGTNSNAFVRFILRNFQGYVPLVSGTAIVAETQLDSAPGASGAVSQSLWPNNALTPANTFYEVQFWSQGRITSRGNYIFNANTNLNTASQLNPAPTPTIDPIVFENNGTLNSSQTLLNLESTDGTVTITDEGDGSIDLAASQTGFGTAGLGGFWSAGLPPTAAFGSQISDSSVSVEANQVTVFQFELPVAHTIRTISGVTGSGIGGATVNFGIYNSAGEKLIDSGALSVASSTTFGATLASPVTLPPGIYYFAQSASVYTVVVDGFVLESSPLLKAQALATGTYVATAANSTSGGVMPATLGTLSFSTYISDTVGMAACFFGV